MLGAIAGDVIGSVYERRPIKTTVFPLFQPESRFTDDTVLTVAVAYAILHEGDIAGALKDFGRRYPKAGYGGAFWEWLQLPYLRPYNSWGNGSAMRVSPVGFAFNDAETVLLQAKRTAEVTHNHAEGIKGAQATALAIFRARTGEGKADLRDEIAERFGYNLNRTVDEIRPDYRFDVSCQGTVPEALIAFLDSTGYEEAVRLAVSLGGDSDTLACIAGGVAHAFYDEVPAEIASNVRQRLPEEFLEIIDEFESEFGGPGWDENA